MKTFNSLTIINFILLLLIITIGIVFYINTDEDTSKSLSYIDNIKLFNEFNMTKDIKIIEEKKITSFKKDLDSIYAIYQNLKNKKTDKAQQLEFQLNAKSKLLKETQDNYTSNLSQQVWNRLNGYIKEFATQNKTKIILGTSGNGNVMYAEENMDITNTLLIYCNKKYEGVN